MKKTDIREGVTYQTKNGSAARRVIKITDDPSEILDGDPSWTEGWVIYEQVRGAAKGMVRELTLPSFAAWAHSEEAAAVPADLAARISQLEADKAALMEVARKAYTLSVLSASAADWDGFDSANEALFAALSALPAHLKEAAKEEAR